MATPHTRSRIQKLIYGTRRGGFEYILSNITDRLPRWLIYYRHSHLLMHDNDEVPIPAPDREYPEYTLRMATVSDSACLEHFGISEPWTRQWLKQGYTLYIALKDGKVVSYHWYGRGNLYLAVSGAFLKTDESEVFGAGASTQQSERRKGLFKGIYIRHREYYLGLGYTKSYATVSNLNIASLAAHESFGYRRVGETYHLELLGIAFTYYRSWPKPHRKFRIGLSGPRSNMLSA